MSILNLFSKRQKKVRGEVTDVYSYTKVPQPLRVQLVHIIMAAIGFENQREILRSGLADQVYAMLNSGLAKEYGLFTLGKPHDTPEHAVLNFLLNEENHERFIDAVEYALKIIDFQIRDNYDYNTTVTIKQSPDAAIQEINERFKENAFGYAYQNGQIIRIDSEFIHIEAIKPVLNLLADKIYAGANQEFLSAFEHYRHKRNKEALVDALKSLESVLKAICTKRKWTYSPNDPAKRLLEVVFANNLVPDFMQSHFSSLRSMLESGVPTVRNKLGGHGQGTQVIEVPEYFVSFAINSTASTILLLVNAEKALK